MHAVQRSLKSSFSPLVFRIQRFSWSAVMSGPSYAYIVAPALAERLQAGEVAEQKTAIVDVRDDDFEGGNIVGARNVPSSNFDAALPKLVEELKDYPSVVFHCHLSQVRGPKAARKYAEAREAALASNKVHVLPEFDAKAHSQAATAAEKAAVHGGQQVLVLTEGFGGFGPKYKDDPKLVEKFDAESWAER